MKKMHQLLVVLAFLLLSCQFSFAEKVTYKDNWGKQGFTIHEESKSNAIVNYSLTNFYFEELEINQEVMQTIKVPGIFLPNDEGAPDLPGTGRYIAIPQGAEVSYKIVSSRTTILKDQIIAPAPRIPLDTEQGPLQYEKDMSIYSKNG